MKNSTAPGLSCSLLLFSVVFVAIFTAQNVGAMAENAEKETINFLVPTLSINVLIVYTADLSGFLLNVSDRTIPSDDRLFFRLFFLLLYLHVTSRLSQQAWRHLRCIYVEQTERPFHSELHMFPNKWLERARRRQRRRGEERKRTK